MTFIVVILLVRKYQFLGTSTLQFLPIVITFVSRCVRVCKCVCVCVSFCVNVCFQVAKILKRNHLYRIDHFQSNGLSPIFLLLDLDLHFQGQTFVILFVLRISRKWSKLVKHYYCHQIGSRVVFVISSLRIL